MRLAASYKGSRIFLDSAPLIYYIEGNERYASFLNELFELASNNEIVFFTSSLTLLEILVLPLRNKQFELAQTYREILTKSNAITMLDMDSDIALSAATIRAKYNFKTPDAIQIASASSIDCDYFLTNDKKLSIHEISTIYLEQIITKSQK